MSIFNDYLSDDTLDSGLESVMNVEELAQSINSENPADTIGQGEDISIETIEALASISNGSTRFEDLDTDVAQRLITSGLVVQDATVTLTEKGKTLAERVHSGEYDPEVGVENIFKRTAQAFKDFTIRRKNSIDRYSKSTVTLKERVSAIRDALGDLGDVKEGAYGFKIKSGDAFGFFDQDANVMKSLPELVKNSATINQYSERELFDLVKAMAGMMTAWGNRMNEASKVTDDGEALLAIHKAARAEFATAFTSKIERALPRKVTVNTRAGEFAARGTLSFFGNRQFVAWLLSDNDYAADMVSWGVPRSSMKAITSHDYQAASKAEMEEALKVTEHGLTLGTKAYALNGEFETIWRKYHTTLRTLSDAFDKSKDGLIRRPLAGLINEFIDITIRAQKILGLISNQVVATGVIMTLYCNHSINRYAQAQKESEAGTESSEALPVVDELNNPVSVMGDAPLTDQYVTDELALGTSEDENGQEPGMESFLDFFRATPSNRTQIDKAMVTLSKIGLRYKNLVAGEGAYVSAYHPNMDYVAYMQRDGKLVTNLIDELRKEAELYDRSTSIVKELTEGLKELGKVDEESALQETTAFINANEGLFNRIFELKFLGGYQVTRLDDQRVKAGKTKCVDADGNFVPVPDSASQVLAKTLKGGVIGLMGSWTVVTATSVFFPLGAATFYLWIALGSVLGRKVTHGLINDIKLTSLQKRELVTGSVVAVSEFKDVVGNAINKGSTLMAACADFSREWDKVVRNGDLPSEARKLAGVYAQVVAGYAQAPMMLGNFVEVIYDKHIEDIVKMNKEMKAQR